MRGGWSPAARVSAAPAHGQEQGPRVGLGLGEPVLMQARLGAPVQVRAGKQVFGGHFLTES